MNLSYFNVIMCSLLCTKIWKLLIFELARNLRFFVLKHVKCVSEDDVLYDNQLIINPILVRRFTPSSMWIKNLFSRRSAAVVVREIQDECIFIVYDFCNPPPLLSILFPYVRNFSFFMPRSIQLLHRQYTILNAIK